MTRFRLISAIATLFLLSAVIFAFNSVPSAPAVDDSDPQASSELSSHKPITAFFFAFDGAVLALMLGLTWGAVREYRAARRGLAPALLPIARGPPER